jgi:hypothetical protein
MRKLGVAELSDKSEEAQATSKEVRLRSENSDQGHAPRCWVLHATIEHRAPSSQLQIVGEKYQ